MESRKWMLEMTMDSTTSRHRLGGMASEPFVLRHTRQLGMMFHHDIRRLPVIYLEIPSGDLTCVGPEAQVIKL